MICIAKILNNIELENIIKEKYKFYNSYIVDIFENTNYSIKKLNTNIKIDGNILDEKLSPCDSIKYIRILKKMNKNIRIIN